MSWSGTVSCRYCGQDGHNQRTCPQRQERLVRDAAAGNKWAQATLERKNRKSNRKCGWCGETGHNKRTCRHPKEAKLIVPLLADTISKLLKKTLGDVGRGSIVEGRHNKNCIVLHCDNQVSLGKSNISEDAVEKNRSNTEWQGRVLASFINRARLKCITPEGGKVEVQLPVVAGKLRGSTIHVGSPACTVKVASHAPIECKVDIDVQSGATAESLKGWVAVISLLLNEVTFEKCQ